MWLLGDSERAVGDLAGDLELPMANVSQHLRVMRDQGAVTSRRQGRSILYRIAHPKFMAGAQLIREGLRDELSRRGQAQDLPAASRSSVA
jgi:DNA-binding transcriptional ArsR family regulator